MTDEKPDNNSEEKPLEQPLKDSMKTSDEHPLKDDSASESPVVDDLSESVPEQSEQIKSITEPEVTKSIKLSGGKKVSAVGIEYEFNAIRAVRITGDDKGNFALEAAEEILGNFAKDEQLVEGLTKIRAKLHIGSKDQLVTNLTGKQVYAAQVPFKLMAPDQMTGALKIQLRKTVPFEIAGSILQHQVVKKAPDKTSPSQVLVSLTSNVTLSRHLRDLKKAGLKPDVTDIHPLAVGNALMMGTEKQDAKTPPSIALHIGSSICSIVIDGPDNTYFHRNIYFGSEEVFGAKKDKVAPRERERKLNALGEEIARSLSYYEKNHEASEFGSIYVFGEFSDEAHLYEIVTKHTGLNAQLLRLTSKSQGGINVAAGKFELATALALRAVKTGETNSHTYITNMVRELRLAENKIERKRLITFAVGCLSFGILSLAIIFTTFRVLTMQGILEAENRKLRRLENEYRKYAATRVVVDKSDIELLDKLQATRIFWTKKLAAMALHLPENYWITEFEYKKNELEVKGYGYISPDQKQLITLDEYLNSLRKDTTFNDDFANTYLDETKRNDEGYRLRVGFEYSSVNKKVNKKGR
ncbi:MAG: pilus assembly protein PilM [Fibrobacteria bacterium]|nr:pilus assembly protein PilM [Fibrobacteria bacterium]